MNALSPDTGTADDPLPLPPQLASIPTPALFLDFDGTLVDIAPHPDAIDVAPALPALIGKLADRLEGRLAIVSGRALADLDRHLGPLNIAMAGSHGGELREHGSATVRALAELLPEDVVERLRDFAHSAGGLLIEPKPFSVAVHYRDRPEAAEGLIAHANIVANDAGLAVKQGKMVVELVMPGSDKGTAVMRLMELSAFRGARPIFVGDDITDEDAFVRVIEQQGGGILVGPQRATAARWRLPNTRAVRHWLEEALA